MSLWPPVLVAINSPTHVPSVNSPSHTYSTPSQCYKYDATTPAGLLQPFPVLTANLGWHLHGLYWKPSKIMGNDTILVVVDILSKYAHFLPLSHPFAAPQVAQLFFSEIRRLHGMPHNIISGPDTIFLSSFWSEVFCPLGSELRCSSSYHPQNDQTKVVNCSVKTYIHCFSMDKPSRWLEWLGQIYLQHLFPYSCWYQPIQGGLWHNLLLSFTLRGVQPPTKRLSPSLYSAMYPCGAQTSLASSSAENEDVSWFYTLLFSGLFVILSTSSSTLTSNFPWPAESMKNSPPFL